MGNERKSPVEPSLSAKAPALSAVGKGLRHQVENLKKKKLVSKKVVSLDEYRELQKVHEERTILVVDDDEVMRNALRRILTTEGYSVLVAQDGIELSRVLERAKLHLVLLDVNLPWVDGFELCRLIRSHASLRLVPIILISGRATKEDVEKGFESGCTDYVAKPFDVNHITTTIARLTQDAVP